MYKVKILTLFMAVTSFIVGCNGSNSESSDIDPTPPKKEISIYTQDTVQFSDGKRPIIIDLRNRIKAENDEDIIISDVKSLNYDNENCRITDINGLSFTTITNDIGICRYEYKVKPVNSSSVGQGRAVSQVIVTEDYDKGEYLPPISSTLPPSTETEPSSIIFDKSQIQIPEGFVVDNVNLIGDTESHELGSVSFDDESITYSAPVDTTGVVRIYYSIVNENSGIIRPGIIYIAIGQSINSNPTAEPISQITALSILDEERSPINVEPYTSDPDNDPIQLVDVYSAQGIIENINGLEFLYIPTETGSNFITYVISDHNGGYAVGQLKSEVSSFRNIHDENQDLTFLAPLTQADLTATQGISSGNYQELGDSGPEGIYPLFDKQLALSYCTTRGLVLPTKEQYIKLFTDKLGETPVYESNYKWISGAPYTAIDGFISLSSGDEFTSATLGYFSCVQYLAGPKEYSFSRSTYLGEFDEDIIITANAETIYGLFPLPPELYALEAEVSHTMPEGLDDKVSIFVSGQTVRVSVDPSIKDEIKNVIVSIKDPEHVQGDIAETKLIYGISECQLNATVEEIQASDCIPIASYVGSSLKMTAPVKYQALVNMGLDMSAVPSIFKPVTNSPVYYSTGHFTSPEYSILDVYDEWATKGKPFVQKYCDILSDLYIGGRNNWVAEIPDTYRTDSEPGWHQVGMNLELTDSPRTKDTIKALQSAIVDDRKDPSLPLRFTVPYNYSHNYQFELISPTYYGFNYQSWWSTQGFSCASLQ
ncbi:hypothetical protein IHC93_17225 [Photobacterium damselae subsp. damselae]|uniref:hypothetical protein n=1 Tax=Photobacterium damselae TaxID=38293 RepID=UPI001F1EE26B|nr:hypothetical protein [Photobacterium damselae]UKA27755.1 hypothetical protein IHC93_17225 [Photobacterium damselae subsp. damselae]